MCQMVVTTRPSAYDGRALIAGFERLAIADLDTDQIDAFIWTWSLLLHERNETSARVHEGALRRALDRADIRRLVRNPLMLTALAVVHWNDKVLPEQRAALFESILTWMAKARPERMAWERRLGLMGTLALGMQSYSGGHKVSLGRGDAAQLLAASGRHDCVIALGVLIGGDTNHHEMVGNSVSLALQQLSLATRLPVINGVIVANTRAQAEAEAAPTFRPLPPPQARMMSSMSAPSRLSRSSKASAILCRISRLCFRRPFARW